MHFFSQIEGDPGIIVIFSSEDEVDRMLSLPALHAIPNLQRGKENHVYTRIIHDCYYLHHYVAMYF